jgi:hypothetical protein
LKRIVLLWAVTSLVMAMMAIGAGTALAEGHYCRHWYPDPYYGGYWLVLDCPADVNDERWIRWFEELPYQEYSNPYLDIGEPYYY